MSHSDILPADLLQLSEVELTVERAIVRAPLARNVNDKGTVFAGSIYSAAALAGYRLVEKAVSSVATGGCLVAKSATIEYLAPINTDALAIARFEKPLRQKRNNKYAAIADVKVEDANQTLCARATIEYVFTPDS